MNRSEGKPPGSQHNPRPAAALRENARRGRSPPPQGTTGGTGNAQPRPEKSRFRTSPPARARSGAARRRNLTHALTTLRPRLGPTYSVNDSSRDVWGSPMGVITLQIGKSWISPVAGGEAQIAPHHHFVQSEVAARGRQRSARLERQQSRCARDDTSLTSFAKWGYLVEPARRAG